MADRRQPVYHYGRSQYHGDARSDPFQYRYDRYEPYEHYDRSPPRSRYSPRYEGRGREVNSAHNDGFSIRGAAERDNYRPRQERESFTFRAPGPAAPRFPSPERYAQPPPQQSSARRPVTSGRGRGKRGPAGQLSDRPHGAQPTRRFGKPAPHQRDILQRARRGSTPEQLHGMNTDGQTRFMPIDSSSDAEDVIDLTNDTDDDIAGDRPRKRVKAEDSLSAEQVAPKWSNPEYFTALPPPENLGPAKKDIVQVIRKAKVESTAKSDSSANAVKDNVDYISFNFGDEDDNMSESDSVGETQPPSNAPTGPAGFGRRGSMQQNGTHGPAGHRSELKTSSPTLQSFNLRAVSKKKDTVGPPPPPPPDLLMPSNEELIEQYGGEPKGKKRKRVEQSKGIGGVVPEWQTNGTNPTPWCTSDPSQTATVGLRFDQEIADFYEFVRPHDYEEQVRRDLIDRVQRAVRSAPKRVAGGGSIEVKSFGSFAAGLYLPTADMDLVAISSEYLRSGQKVFCQSATNMHVLGRHIAGIGLVGEGTMSPVTRAKVPLLKFTDRQTRIKVDISFENDSGLQAIETFRKWKVQYPAMPVIVVLIKQMLAMRDLNEVFTGGLGGFSIICLVVSMLQLTPDIQSGSMDPQQRYGELLLHFLDLYGNKFNIKTTGIMFHPPGYYDKINHPKAKQNPDRLTIIDPNNPNNDISGGSREIGAVFALFRTAHLALQRRLDQINSREKDNESILGCIWGGNYSSFIHQRNRLSLLHRGQPVSSPPPPEPRPQQHSTFSKRQTHLPAPRREQNYQPEPLRQPPPPPKQQSRPQVPPKQQTQQGRAQHPLPQRPPQNFFAN